MSVGEGEVVISIPDEGDEAKEYQDKRYLQQKNIISDQEIFIQQQALELQKLNVELDKMKKQQQQVQQEQQQQQQEYQQYQQVQQVEESGLSEFGTPIKKGTTSTGTVNQYMQKVIKPEHMKYLDIKAEQPTPQSSSQTVQEEEVFPPGSLPAQIATSLGTQENIAYFPKVTQNHIKFYWFQQKK